MFLSEKKLIAKVIEQSLTATGDNAVALKNTQTAYSFLYNNYLLLTFAIMAVVSYFVVFSQQSEHLFLTTVWSLGTLITIGILFFYQQLIVPPALERPISIKRMHRFLILSSTLLGGFMAFGLWTTLHNHGLPTDHFNYAQLGYLFFVIVTNMIAVPCLCYRFQYITPFLGLTFITFFALCYMHWQTVLDNPFTYLYALSYVPIVMAIFWQERKTRSHSSRLYIKNTQLLRAAETQKELSELSKIQLENEIHQREQAETKLHEHNQKLEDTIAERTQYISKINANLIRSKNSLEMAYLAAGMASWDWDIENKRLTGKNFDVLLGYPPERIHELSHNVYPILHPEDTIIFEKNMRNVVSNQQQTLDMKIRAKNVHDEWLWVEFKGTSVSQDADTKRIKRMVGVCRDITLEKNIADSLALSNSVFEQSVEAIFILDNQFKYISVNPSFERVTGFSHDEMAGRSIFSNQREKLGQHGYDELINTLKTTGKFSGEITELNKSGERMFLNVSVNAVYNDNNDVVNYIGIFSDITQQTQDRQKLSYLANYDPLTDLPNRTFFKQQLHTLLTEKADKFAVVRVNIDRFRILNNSLGSKNADLLLKLVSERLSQLDYSVRALARIAGDDFAVLLSHLSLHSLKDYIDSILDSFKKPFYINNQEIGVSLSVGVSLYPQHGHQVDTLMNRSEQALKRAKLNGGNDYFIYNQGLQVSSLDNLQLENELRRAIAHGELVLFYQPKVDLQSGKLLGFEALVRWHHEKKGLMLPGEFIGLAAETGLINDLTVEVLSQTCQQLRRWHDYGLKDVTVAVNIEARQLKRGNFLSMLDNVMEASQVDGSKLEIEITESSLMDMPEKIKPILASIKSRDISISLDDFGTGYSSLSYLSQYPIDVLKIDRSFIRDISTNEQSAAIARAIIAMGHSLGMTLVAEGVENAKQRDFLHSEGCQVGQGYFYGKPMPVTEATKILQQQHKNSSVFSDLAIDSIPVTDKIQ